MNLKKRILVNPLVLFERAIINAQGLLKFSENFDNQKTKMIKKSILSKTKIKEFDLLITDPPYMGLIEYEELSSVWNVWLSSFFDMKHRKVNGMSFDAWKKLIMGIFKKTETLKVNGKIIISINHNKLDLVEEIISISNNFKGIELLEIREVKIDRSSESNVGKENWHNMDKYLIFIKKEV